MTATTLRPVVLCADDYAISAGVSRGIVELARIGRISATSAMSVMPGWPQLARDLVEVEERIGIGLHLTFTGAPPLGPMPILAPSGGAASLATLLRLSLLGRLPGAEIEAEIDRQLDAFTAARSRDPDFVDGHQHVHALPGIREPLLRSLARRGLAGRIWLRDPADTPLAIARRGVAARKALVVAGLASGFAAAATRAGFALNRGFSGFSPFAPMRDPRRDFASFLVAPGAAHLVMCHPGHVQPGDMLDEVVESRERELAFLASAACPALLDERGIGLVPSPRSRSPAVPVG